MTKLTVKQKIFAEENHNLIYGFMRNRKLNHDEWYDIVVFGYLNAVISFQPDKSKFSTFAWRCMTNAVGIELRSRKQHKRIVNNKNISFNAIIKNDSGDETELMDLAVDDCVFHDNSDIQFTFDAFLNTLPLLDRKILKLKFEGYSIKEIGDMISLPQQYISREINMCFKEYCKIAV